MNSANEFVHRVLDAVKEAVNMEPCMRDGRALSELCRWCGAEPWTGCRWRDPECKAERAP